jgi:hypothetical protein
MESWLAAAGNFEACDANTYKISEWPMDPGYVHHFIVNIRTVDISRTKHTASIAGRCYG